MSTHETCGQPGKFDCAYDEYVYDTTLDDGGGNGDVEAPVGWWATVDLTDADVHDAAAAEHYGVRWLIVRENGQGIVWVEAYALEADRDARDDALAEGYRLWYSDALSGEEESWDAR